MKLNDIAAQEGITQPTVRWILNTKNPLPDNVKPFKPGGIRKKVTVSSEFFEHDPYYKF